MYNQITLIGNLGSDVEMRYTPAGVPVASFSFAVNEQWNNEAGQKQEKVIWFKVSAWRKQAETASQYLAKGRQVLVVGKLEDAKVYQARDGTWKASLDVTAQTVKFLGGQRETGEQSAVGEQSAPAATEDIPF